MEMRYFYICDIVKHNEIKVKYHSGKENIGNYASKYHDKKFTNRLDQYTYIKKTRLECYHGQQIRVF